MSETFGLEIYASNKLAYAGRAQKISNNLNDLTNKIINGGK